MALKDFLLNNKPFDPINLGGSSTPRGLSVPNFTPPTQQPTTTPPVNNPVIPPATPPTTNPINTPVTNQINPAPQPLLPNGMTLQEALAIQAQNQATPPTPPTETVTKKDIPARITPQDFQADPTPQVKQQNDFIAQQQARQQDFLQALQPTQAEIQLTQQINDLNQRARDAIDRAEQRLAPTFAITGEQAAIDRKATNERQGLAANLNALISQRQTRIDGLTSLMKFSKENMDTLINLQKLTMPDVLSTQTDKQTGEISVLSRDPQTGAITQKVVGRVTPEVAKMDFVKDGVITNKNTGEVTWYGVTQPNANGQPSVIRQVVGNEGVAPIKPKGNKISTSELKQFINKQISTPDFRNLSPEDKKLYIRSQGGDPFNFGF